MTARFSAGGKVAIAGYAQSPIERHSSKTVGALAVETVRAAIADAGLTVADVDGFVGAAMLPTSGDHAQIDGQTVVSADWLVEHLGAEPAYVAGFQGNAQLPGSVVMAVNAIAAGGAQCVVVHRALHNPAGRYHGNRSLEAAGEFQWTTPQGFAPFAMIGLAYNEYLQRYNAPRSAMAEVVVEARRSGSRIPWSYWAGRPLTAEEYLAEPVLADPISRLDCDIPIDGAAAFVFTTAERARSLPNHPVYVAGYASATPARSRVRLHWPLDDMMESGEGLAARLWAHAGIGPGDVDLPQVYDGFSPFVYFWLETLGYCGYGEAHQFVQGGGIDSSTPSGLAVLSGGGALGNGRMHGVPQMLECYLQLSGRAGERQRPHAEVGLACHSSPHHGGVVAYTREPV